MSINDEQKIDEFVSELRQCAEDNCYTGWLREILNKAAETIEQLRAENKRCDNFAEMKWAFNKIRNPWGGKGYVGREIIDDKGNVILKEYHYVDYNSRPSYTVPKEDFVWEEIANSHNAIERLQAENKRLKDIFLKQTTWPQCWTFRP